MLEGGDLFGWVSLGGDELLTGLESTGCGAFSLQICMRSVSSSAISDHRGFPLAESPGERGGEGVFVPDRGELL